MMDFIVDFNVYEQVGSWSKWLSDFFGLEESESPRNQDESDDAFKAFRLLKALGDLMMLPLGMLSDVTIRKEVSKIFVSKNKSNSRIPICA